MELKPMDMPYIPLSHLRKLVRNMSKSPDDMHITFEFLMTACFPSIWKTIQDYMKDCYTAGYKAGKEAAGGDKNIEDKVGNEN